MKRVVLIHRSGLHQILGTTDQLKEGLGVAELPSFLENVQYGDHTGSCSLVMVKPRYVVYKETIAPLTLGRFNEEQR